MNSLPLLRPVSHFFLSSYICGHCLAQALQSSVNGPTEEGGGYRAGDGGRNQGGAEEQRSRRSQMGNPARWEGNLEQVRVGETRQEQEEPDGEPSQVEGESGAGEGGRSQEQRSRRSQMGNSARREGALEQVRVGGARSRGAGRARWGTQPGGRGLWSR